MLYHLLVMLHARGITLAEVEALLESRTKKSGLEEKASRPANEPTSELTMEQRIDDGLSPYRIYTRAEWAALREDMPMTLTPGRGRRGCARCTTGST